MSTPFTKIVIGIGITLTVVLVGGYVALRVIGSAYSSECEKSESWSLKEYKIQEYKCLGWAGPPYYSIHLYKNENKIDEHGNKLDSCRIVFSPKKDLFIDLNQAFKSCVCLF